MKLVVDAETDKVVGASMCGPDAPEIIQVCFVSYSISMRVIDMKFLCTFNFIYLLYRMGNLHLQFYLFTLYNG
jgi:hypothetical protein